MIDAHAAHAVREERKRILAALAKLCGPVIMRTDIEKIIRNSNE